MVPLNLVFLKEVKSYCQQLLLQQSCRRLPFHNLEHTQEVVKNVKILSQELRIGGEKTLLLQIAAWFHDTGFAKTYKNHEEGSKEFAFAFLTKERLDAKYIDLILSCIESTKMHQEPKDMYQEILCDADIFHISTPHFFYRKLLLRKEWEIFCNLKVTDLEWHQLNLEFLQKKFILTPVEKYGKKGGGENIARVQQILAHF